MPGQPPPGRKKKPPILVDKEGRKGVDCGTLLFRGRGALQTLGLPQVIPAGAPPETAGRRPSRMGPGWREEAFIKVV
jgi:hypothetical protein